MNVASVSATACLRTLVAERRWRFLAINSARPGSSTGASTVIDEFYRRRAEIHADYGVALLGHYGRHWRTQFP